MNKKFKVYVVISITLSVLAFVFINAVTQPSLTKIVDASLGDNEGNSFSYAYAPYMVMERNSKTIHAFYCSTSIKSLGYTNWDAVRYSVSHDAGKTWSKPSVAVKVSDPVNERAACDPSVVYYDGYYYMYYSGNQEDVQTVVLVARSKAIAGPYLKYTERGTWEANPHDPKILIRPINPALDGTKGAYGAGQTTTVVKDGIIHIWHNDNTGVAGIYRDKIYYQKSTNPVNLGQKIATNVTASDRSANSIDIKWDPVTKRFVMFSLLMGHYQHTKIVVRYSSDGISWTSAETYCDENCTPDFSNNIGALGTQEGFLLPGNFLAYGVPYDLGKDCAIVENGVDKNCWGYWDIFGGLYSNLDQPGGQILGFIDGVKIVSTGYRVNGWGCAYGANMPISVHVYAQDLNTSERTYIGKTTTSLTSSSNVAANCGTGYYQHRYQLILPPEIMEDHHGKKIIAYGISPYKMYNNRLTNSEKFSLPTGEIKGYIDSVTETSSHVNFGGWACATGSDYDVKVHLKFQDPATGNVDHIGSVVANLSSEPAVTAACENTKTASRYNFSIPKSSLMGHTGKKVLVYGISPYGLKNRLLSGSGLKTVP